MPNANIYSAGLWLVGGLATVNSPLYPVRVLYALVNGSFSFAFVLVYVAIYYLASFWASQVTKVVPDPYLVCQPFFVMTSPLTIYRTRCSIFPKRKHIALEGSMFGTPSSQPLLDCELLPIVYRNPKLMFNSYLLSTLIASQFSQGGCMVFRLRFHNVIALMFLLSYAIDCRGLITLSWNRDRKEPIRKWIADGRTISADMIHTGANIALFPLLFFFSGLYYTDVLSTCVVLGMYRLFLERQGARANTSAGLIWLYPAGLVALIMRQTNIFWVAVFMGALELVRTLKANKLELANQRSIPRTWREMGIEKFRQYSHGHIHDVPLKDAGVIGMSSIHLPDPKLKVWQTLFCAQSALRLPVCFSPY